MLLSYNWLKQLLPSLRRIPPERMLKFLRAGIANAESFEKLNKTLNNKIVVGEIIDITNHPNADKLRLVVVNIGKEKVKVVCGASNIEKGQKVPIALNGAMLPNNQVIKSTVIRGVKSNGMLCSEKELGIGSDAKGICIFPEHFKVGQPIVGVLGLNDVIFDIENKSITHRPDLFNHLGFVREISAYLNLRFDDKIKKTKIKNIIKKPETALDIKIQEENICSRYMAVVLDDIKICPSSQWMQNRLRNLGIQPINNVVDVMNYVMLEMGQPLHAFDFDKISTTKNKKLKQIIIRKAHSGEKILALDERRYELTKDDIVITDDNGPIALAGLIGGQNSGINNNTKRIIIESANFNPVALRRTSWRLGLRTEAVLRFEKGLPLIFAEIGISRAIQLIQEVVGAKVVSKVYDIKSRKDTIALNKRHNIIFNFERARKFIGVNILDK
ncbi:phenylalanine--tRNA ligase subunit beta, partial [bacterium]|nr:phenylalanine--tRNA ligase subunit beta [bacterium]